MPAISKEQKKERLMLLALILCAFASWYFVLSQCDAAPALSLDKLHLQPGFHIQLYARVPGARQLALSPNGTLFVGTRENPGHVYAAIDKNKDGKIDEVRSIANGLFMPNGVQFRDGSLYVGEVHRIIRFDDIENRLRKPPEPVVVSDAYFKNPWHGWKYIRFGPDGMLYVPVGAPCNACEPTNAKFASMTRIKPDGSGFEIVAKGIRNTVGFDWDPKTKELWFTDNGRDLLGDNIPPDELNHAKTTGLDFGFPYRYGNNVPDPEFGAKKRGNAEFTPPAQCLDAHVAALGMRFYTGKMFPSEYKNKILIAEHGSWNRSTPIGYRVTAVTLDQTGKAIKYEPFIDGWLVGSSSWGRPVDLEIMPDGSLLISDDQQGAVYRVTYDRSKH